MVQLGIPQTDGIESAMSMLARVANERVMSKLADLFEPMGFSLFQLTESSPQDEARVHLQPAVEPYAFSQQNRPVLLLDAEGTCADVHSESALDIFTSGRESKSEVEIGNTKAEAAADSGEDMTRTLRTLPLDVNKADSFILD